MSSYPPKMDDQTVLDSCAVDIYTEAEIEDIIERGRREFRREWFRYAAEWEDNFY